MDENDRAWLYGGRGVNSAEKYDRYGSIWTFDTRGKREYELEYGPDTFRIPPQVVSSDYNADNHPGAGEALLFIDRMDGTLMLVGGGMFTDQETSGASDTLWLYSKSLKQWKLVYGNDSSIQSPGAYVNYRQAGSEFASVTYMGRSNGNNLNGDVFIVGGSRFTSIQMPTRKDIWFIPLDQCTVGNSKCDVNADCVEEMIGYSCVCKDGYTGDGFTCTVTVPVASPMAAPVSSSPVAATPKQQASSASVISAPFILAAFGFAL
eukprot:TRINITY_DN2432_c0_g1_i2.p2 TRINITY_DN2432_c0_g1~~TRINITY_DN2432_c0_g1_i2.p2  ORF type:complete len:263 (+),score=59.27 TRINITY_DN2432_c0_g1_i2:587-1375(+)